MKCGVSTACFYPIDTNTALEKLKQINVKTAEIFFNTFSEVTQDYLDELKEIAQAGNIDIVSVHPFCSAMEPFFFATDYQARYKDGEKIYRDIFKAASFLGAKILAFHGDYVTNPYSFSNHCEKFKELRKVGLEYGVTLCQENVVRCKCGFPEKILRMRDILNDDVDFIFDTKQAYRAGIKPQQMLDAMQGKIRHIHLSDYTEKKDCVLPGDGITNFDEFVKMLKAQNYDSNIIIEVYSDAYETLQQVEHSLKFIEKYF